MRRAKLLQQLILISLLPQLLPSGNAQNLIRNPSFEEHKPLPYFDKVYLPRSTSEFVFDWEFLANRYPVYCRTEYLDRFGDENYKRAGYLYFPRSIGPHTGDAMMKLIYMESFFSYDGKGNKIRGGASYACSRLTEPLSVGEVYAVSFWIYFPKYDFADPAIYDHIGFYLSLKKEEVDLLETQYFFGDTIRVDQWMQVKYYVRALCALNYLTIGAFKDETFPSIFRSIYNHVEFYIDDVSVVKINEDTLNGIEPTPYCEYYAKRPKVTKPTADVRANVYFETERAVLDDMDRHSLDSFYNATKDLTGFSYVLTGHTDNENYDNLNLSIARTRAVESYLRQTYGLSQYKFVSFGKGSSNPLGNNETASGRQINRRVTISTSYIRTSGSVYRNGLKYIAQEDYDSALQVLKIWVNTVPPESKMAILHDPRLKVMRSQPQWNRLRAEVLKAYASYVNPALAFFLDSMYYVDQRHRSFSPRSLTGYMDGLDTFSTPDLNVDLDDFARIDSINMIPMRAFLDEYGFPKISEVGRRQVRTACLMIIHTLDTILMRSYLPLIHERCLEGEAEWDVYAMMYDKRLSTQGLPQIYGTQSTFINPEKTQYQLYQVDDLEAVNERRRKIGLPPIVNDKEIFSLRQVKE